MRQNKKSIMPLISYIIGLVFILVSSLAYFGIYFNNNNLFFQNFHLTHTGFLTCEILFFIIGILFWLNGFLTSWMLQTTKIQNNNKVQNNEKEYDEEKYEIMGIDDIIFNGNNNYYKNNEDEDLYI